MFTLTKSFTIAASHCITGHPKCGRMHGHNYKIEIEIGSPILNENGMLIDFSNLKTIIEKTLKKYDHKHLGVLPFGWTSNPDHVMELPFDLTTAENLARYWGTELLTDIRPLRLLRVNVFESEQSMASWIPPLEEE